MTSAEFAPLRPRRIAVLALETACDAVAPSADAQRAYAGAGDPGGEEQQTHSDPSSVTDIALGTDEVARHTNDTPAPYDGARFVEEVRTAAVRFASIATARALRVALADERTIATYVDDALRACGRLERATVRLHPVDAASYRPNGGIDVVADGARERGEVVVETSSGALGATIEQRAGLLVRAAAS